MQVEIWSDVVCPWCYVGTRRFEAAAERLAAEDGIALEVVHRAFELDPTVPAGGKDLGGYLAGKFGSAARVAQVRDRLAHAAAGVDVDFRWEGKRRVNTFDAHRLAAWALEAGGAGAQHDLHQRLFRAYFTDDLDIADHGVLAGLAADAGLDRDLAAEALATGAHADTVRAEELRAGELDIHAVPTFLLAGSWAIPGAQDVDTFVDLLRRAAERLAPLTVDAGAAGAAGTTGDAACDDGACDV
ncbi:MAG TPA: DsbA family oxidoreductase [Acidimicrobiales bacterium]|nr:DsbA family oxidoreductase [Acidimicrobiales bacterium]